MEQHKFLTLLLIYPIPKDIGYSRVGKNGLLSLNVHRRQEITFHSILSSEDKQNLMTSWLPENHPAGWMFAANTSGWTSNYHGMKWIKHFDTSIRDKLHSPNEYRLLLCDGHDSHVSADFVSFCIQNCIDLLLLPPHSSHLLQPLDVSVFGPLKRAIPNRISRHLCSETERVQKVEWMERFIETQEEAITKDNILSGWRAAGLISRKYVSNPLSTG